MVFAEIACCELLRSQAFYMLGYLRGLFNYMSWFASSGFVFDERLLTAKVLRLYRERILTAEASRGGKGEKRMGVCPLPHSGGRLQILHGPWRFFGQFHSSTIYHGLCLIQESRGVAVALRAENDRSCYSIGLFHRARAAELCAVARCVVFAQFSLREGHCPPAHSPNWTASVLVGGCAGFVGVPGAGAIRVLSATSRVASMGIRRNPTSNHSWSRDWEKLEPAHLSGRDVSCFHTVLSCS